MNPREAGALAVGSAYDITLNLNCEVIMNGIYQDLEKMVRDVEKGARQVQSFVKLNDIEYDVRCYCGEGNLISELGDIKIILHRREVLVGNKT